MSYLYFGCGFVKMGAEKDIRNPSAAGTQRGFVNGMGETGTIKQERVYGW